MADEVVGNPEGSPLPQIEQIFRGLYMWGVLRDFIGKIVPGTLVLVVLVSMSTRSNNIRSLPHNFTSLEFLIIAGLAWNVTVFLQALGDKKGFIPFTAENKSKFCVQQTQLNLFRKNASEEQKVQFERLLVVKEASGNMALALRVVCWICFSKAIWLCALVVVSKADCLSGVLKKFALQSPPDGHMILGCVGSGALCLLCIPTLSYMSELHKDRQLWYVDLTLRDRAESTPEG